MLLKLFFSVVVFTSTPPCSVSVIYLSLLTRVIMKRRKQIAGIIYFSVKFRSGIGCTTVSDADLNRSQTLRALRWQPMQKSRRLLGFLPQSTLKIPEMFRWYEDSRLNCHPILFSLFSDHRAELDAKSFNLMNISYQYDLWNWRKQPWGEQIVVETKHLINPSSRFGLGGVEFATSIWLLTKYWRIARDSLSTKSP